MRIKLMNFLALGLFCVVLTSCYYNKRLVYFQDKHYSEKRPTLVESKKTVYHLQPSDILSVQIKSGTESMFS